MGRSWWSICWCCFVLGLLLGSGWIQYLLEFLPSMVLCTEFLLSCFRTRASWPGQPQMPWLNIWVLVTQRISWPRVPIHFSYFLMLIRCGGSGSDPVISVLWRGRWVTAILSLSRNGLLGSLRHVIAPASFLGFPDFTFLLFPAGARSWNILAELPISLCPWHWWRWMVSWYS